ARLPAVSGFTLIDWRAAEAEQGPPKSIRRVGSGAQAFHVHLGKFDARFRLGWPRQAPRDVGRSGPGEIEAAESRISPARRGFPTLYEDHARSDRGCIPE